MNREAWLKSVEPLMPGLLEIRRHLHRYPEVSGEEHATHAFLRACLEPLGVELQDFPGCESLMATLRNGDGPCIAIRADMDALPVREATGLPFASEHPGVMHACGHDVHMTLALGSAFWLSRHRDAWSGTVKWMFESEEETVGGGKRMTEQGCMENPKVDCIIGQHVNPSYPAGTFYCKTGYVSGASDEVLLTVRGKGCHGAYPERGRDAIVIACELVVALQTMISRTISPLDSAVLTFGTIQGGRANNIVCDEVTLHGTLRRLREDTRGLLKQRIREAADGITRALGGDAELLFRPSYGAVRNSEPYYSLVEDCAREILGADHIVTREAPSLGVESFYYFIRNTPGVYYDLGSGISSALHAPDFVVDERMIPEAVALQCACVLRLMEQIREERAC